MLSEGVYWLRKNYWCRYMKDLEGTRFIHFFINFSFFVLAELEVGGNSIDSLFD